MKVKIPILFELLFMLGGVISIALGIAPFIIVVLFLLAWASLFVRKTSWRDVGLRKPNKWLPTIGLALLVGSVYQFADIYLISPLLQELTGSSANLSLFSEIRGNLLYLLIFLAITWTEAAFIEEMFFRGYLFNRFTDLFGSHRTGTIISLVITALVFGVGHIYQGITGMLDTVLAGVLLGLLYLFAGRNLWLPILVHGIVDTLGFLLIYTGLYGS